MAIFQPSNIIPSTFSGLTESVVSASDPLVVSWQVNGNSPMTGFMLEVFQNDAESTNIWSVTVDLTANPFYGTDAKGNPNYYTYAPSGATWGGTVGVSNGPGAYKLKITQYWGSAMENSVAQYSDSVFYCKSLPTLTLNLPDGDISSASADFTATYAQAQGDAINWVRWELAQGADGATILDDTGNVPTAILSYQYFGFQSGTYSIRCTVETSGGQQVTTGWQSFTVSYDEASAIQTLTLSCADNDDCALLGWADSVVNNGTPSPTTDYGTFENDRLTLNNDAYVTWDVDITGNYSIGAMIDVDPAIKLSFTQMQRGFSSFNAANCEFSPDGKMLVVTGTFMRLGDTSTSYALIYQVLDSGSLYLVQTLKESDPHLSGLSGCVNIIFSQKATPDSGLYPFVLTRQINTTNESDIVWNRSSYVFVAETVGNVGVNYVQKAEPYMIGFTANSEYAVFIEQARVIFHDVTFSNDTVDINGGYSFSMPTGVQFISGAISPTEINGNPCAVFSSYTASGVWQFVYESTSSTFTRIATHAGVTVMKFLGDGNLLFLGGDAYLVTYSGSGVDLSTAKISFEVPSYPARLRLLGTYSYNKGVSGTLHTYTYNLVLNDNFICVIAWMDDGNSFSGVALEYFDGNVAFAINSDVLYALEAPRANSITFSAFGVNILNDYGAILTVGSYSFYQISNMLITRNIISTYNLASNSTVIRPSATSAYVEFEKDASQNIARFTFSNGDSGVLSPPTTLPATVSSVKIGYSSNSAMPLTYQYVYGFDTDGGGSGLAPVWNRYTYMLTDFASGTLSAGVSQSTSVDTVIYRKKADGTDLTLLSEVDSDVQQMKDYGIASATSYVYEKFYVDADGAFFGADVSATPFCKQFRAYSLIEATRDATNPNIYHVVKVFRFACNVNAGGASNNNSPSFLTNFTPYRLKQPVARVGKSGTLQALIGYVDPVTMRYVDNTSMMDSLYEASASANTFFLKDMKGNVYMVAISGPITQTINTKTKYQQVTVSVPWEEVGDASGLSIIQLPTDAGWSN